MNFRIWAAAPVLGILCSVLATGAQAQAVQQADYIVAVVNSEPITNSEVRTALQRVANDMAQQRQAATLGIWAWLITELLLFSALFLVALSLGWLSASEDAIVPCACRPGPPCWPWWCRALSCCSWGKGVTGTWRRRLPRKAM